MCLDYLSDRARKVGKLYSILVVETDGIQRMFRKHAPFDVDEDGWEYATNTLLSCGRSVDEHYRSGFHMFESLRDAIDVIMFFSDIRFSHSIIVAFEWDDIKVQGEKTFKNVSVVGARKPLYIAWDSRHEGGE
ncbi:MAG: hypothetical protein SVY53_05200 [Chloroflexota bacterium]|nr:hypothetical protein [Chloroflexota bacterium]